MEIYCKNCGKHLMTIRDARLRDGMVAYCKECNAAIQLMVKPQPKTPSDEIFSRIFGGFR